jgi:hypothetical protein
MVQFGEKPSTGTLFRASQFLSEELPIRLAHRVQELNDLPDGLNEMPSICRVRDWYAQSFEVPPSNRRSSNLTHNCAGARPAAPTEPFQRRQRPPPEARQAHTAAHQGDAEPQHTKGPVPLGAGERQWQWQRQGPQGRNLEPQILCRRRRRPGLAARAERIQHEIRRHPGEDQEAARQRRHHGRAGHPGVEAQETADAD